MTPPFKSIEILCPACRQDTLLKRVPLYVGFKRMGETLICASCGHTFANEAAVPFKGQKPSPILDRADIPKTPQVFQPDDIARLCRHCAHYVVNPFVQRCSLRQKIIEATDTCAHFEQKPQSPPASGLPCPGGTSDNRPSL